MDVFAIRIDTPISMSFTDDGEMSLADDGIVSTFEKL